VTEIGIVALQGDVREHAHLVRSLGWKPHQVRLPEDLRDLDGLIFPGGESTTIARLADRFGLVEPLRQAITGGLPTFGTCAGMIFLASEVAESSQLVLGVLDATVQRNAFGRQNDSFEADLDVKGFDEPFHAVFIRAPWFGRVGKEVEVLAELDGHPVLVRQGTIVAAAFHPELTGDSRLHKMALSMGAA